MWQTQKPNFKACVGVMVLTLLPELIRALTSSFLNQTGYLIHGTRFKTNFLLALIIGKEVAEINTSFLEVWYKYSKNSLFCYSYNT